MQRPTGYNDLDEVPAGAWEKLSPHLTTGRQSRLMAAVAKRTRHVRLVVQDVHHPHNVSACMRSAEAFGVQDVDVVCLKEKFNASTVAKGVAQWLTIRKWQTIADCAASLRAGGYRLIAGVPPRLDAVSLYDLPMQEKTAVIFGNEHAGIHPDWQAHIDQVFTIPMAGLVESLNISVSAALTLSYMTRQSLLEVHSYYLSEAEQSQLLGFWASRQLAMTVDDVNGPT